MRRLLARFDAHAAGARSAWPAPLVLGDGPGELDLRAAGVGTVLWATGFRRRYDWLPAGAAGPDGELVHRRGVTRVPGLLALGLPFQYRRTSHMIGGVGADAAYLAATITAERRRPTAMAA